MHEQAKINEARYFLDQLPKLVNEREKFNYTLSAFLSAARSALQYAYKEAAPKRGGQDWHNGQVAVNGIVKFFKDKRDISVHVSPVNPAAKIGVFVTDKVVLSDSCSVTIQRKDGTIEPPESTSPPSVTPKEPSRTESGVEFEYFFPDWPGKEDVLTLCAMYLAEVGSIVSDGVAKGFLSVQV